MPIYDNNVFTKTPLQEALSRVAVVSDFVGGIPGGALADLDVVDQATLSLIAGGTANWVAGGWFGHPGVIVLDAPAGGDVSVLRYNIIEQAQGNTIQAVAVVHGANGSGPDVAVGLSVGQIVLPATVGSPRAQIVLDVAASQWRVDFDDGVALLLSQNVGAPYNGAWTRLEIVMSEAQTTYYIDGTLVASWPSGFPDAPVQCGVIAGADTGSVDVDLFGVQTGGLNR